mgnify:CR=1 FL=1|jgi:septum site-determining protein MinC
MSAVKDLVTIKGVKDGLIFILDEHCDYEDLIRELEYKLENSHQRLLSGAEIKVHIRTSNRIMSDKDKERICGIIGRSGNLIVASIDNEPVRKRKSGLKVHTGVVRSGQILEHDGDMMLLGDLNPGGIIRTSGSLFVMGALRGMAHAGKDGDTMAVIAASYMRPTQLRIADVVSRPPDEWDISDAQMEFAYLVDGVMKIDRISQFCHVRPDLFSS